MGELRQFSPPFKAERVLELLSGAQTPAEVCRRVHGIKPSLLLAWRKRLLEQAPKVFEREGDRDPAQARIADLERLVGCLPLGLEVEKKPPLFGGYPGSEAGSDDAPGARLSAGGGRLRVGLSKQDPGCAAHSGLPQTAALGLFPESGSSMTPPGW